VEKNPWFSQGIFGPIKEGGRVKREEKESRQPATTPGNERKRPGGSTCIGLQSAQNRLTQAWGGWQSWKRREKGKSKRFHGGVNIGPSAGEEKKKEQAPVRGQVKKIIYFLQKNTKSQSLQVFFVGKGSFIDEKQEERGGAWDRKVTRNLEKQNKKRKQGRRAEFRGGSRRKAPIETLRIEHNLQKTKSKGEGGWVGGEDYDCFQTT